MQSNYISYFLILPSEQKGSNKNAVLRRYKQDRNFCKDNGFDFGALIDRGLCMITSFGDWAYLSYFPPEAT